MSPQPAQPCTVSAGPCHQDLHSPARALFCWAVGPPTLEDLCFTGTHPQGLHNPAQYSFQKPVPLRPDKQTSSFCWTTPPPSLSSQGFIDTQDLHSTGLCPSGMPSPRSKGCYFTSAKGLHPKACGTPPTIDLPQEGSKPTHTDRSGC
jgi:hypothetical protein